MGTYIFFIGTDLLVVRLIILLVIIVFILKLYRRLKERLTIQRQQLASDKAMLIELQELHTQILKVDKLLKEVD